MDYYFPFNEETGQMDPGLSWVNEGVASGVEGSIPPAEFFHGLQQEILFVIQQSGQNPDRGDLTQLYQAILLLTRVTADEGQSSGYRDIYVPTDYPTLQAAIDFIAPLAIPRDLTVRIFLEPGAHLVNTANGMVVFDHPNGNRVQIHGRSTGAFPSAASVNLTTNSATKAVLESVWPSRISVSGAVRAGLYIKDGSIGLIKDLLFIGDGTALQHGLLFGDWTDGHGRSGGKIENCAFHGFGEDGLRANYNSEIVAYNIISTWNGKFGVRIANQSCLTLTGDSIACRNGQSGFYATDMSFIEQWPGKIDARNNGNQGIASFNNSEVALGVSPNSTGNTGYGFYSANGAWMYTTHGGVVGSGNSLGSLGAFVQGRMQITGAAGLGLTASPSLDTVGNFNSYIMG